MIGDIIDEDIEDHANIYVCGFILSDQVSQIGLVF